MTAIAVVGVGAMGGRVKGPEQIVAAVETATGVTADVIGKPEPLIFEIARKALPECENVAVVGDNLASDIAGAKRSGLDAMLVPPAPQLSTTSNKP